MKTEARVTWDFLRDDRLTVTLNQTGIIFSFHREPLILRGDLSQGLEIIYRDVIILTQIEIAINRGFGEL